MNILLRRGVRAGLGALRPVGCLAVVYGVIAYAVLPAAWLHVMRGHEQALAGGPASPSTTLNRVGMPSDPLNIAVIGTREELLLAMNQAGWRAADPVTFGAAARTVCSVLLGRPYPAAPLSDQYVWGRAQDLAFEQPSGDSCSRRHHVRFWRCPRSAADGRPVWVGAATHDVGIGVCRRTLRITHRICADVDAERDKLLADLARAGQIAAPRVEPTRQLARSGENGTGDRYFTDGRMMVAVIGPSYVSARAR